MRQPGGGENLSDEPEVRAPTPRRRFLYVGFLLLSAYTILCAGALPYVERDDQFISLLPLFALIFDLGVLARGLPYAAWLLAILGCHEMGHYLACRYYRIDATPPLFLPGPVFPFGTFGAFIRIRSPFPDRRSLFDVGIAGPLAGFAVALPALWYGYAHSTVVPIDGTGGIELGESLLLRVMAHWAAPPQADGQTLLLHPAAYAGWVGVLVTALNLLPAGQLDGGHVVYALTRRWHRAISLTTVVALAGLGVIYPGWAFWGLIILLVIGTRHPSPIEELTPLGAGRCLVALLGLAILVVCFIPVPFPFV